MSEIYPCHVYVYAVEDGVTVSKFKALNVSKESAERWKKDAEARGFFYNVIQNGKIVATNDPR